MRLKYFLSSFVICMTLTTVGLLIAEDDISISTGIIGNGRYLGAKTINGETTVPVLGVDSNGSTVLNTLSGTDVRIQVAKTPVVNLSSGQAYNPVAATVLTPAVTPLSTPAATNQLTARVSMMAAAAPTSAFVALPAATANVGKQKSLWNSGANPTQIMPASGDTINALGAATPFACAAGKLCDCVGVTSSVSQCIAQ